MDIIKTEDTKSFHQWFLFSTFNPIFIFDNYCIYIIFQSLSDAFFTRSTALKEKILVLIFPTYLW